MFCILMYTWKINMEPENHPLDFGDSMLVLGALCTNLTEEQCLNSVGNRDDRAIEVRSDDLFKMSSVSSEMWERTGEE